MRKSMVLFEPLDTLRDSFLNHYVMVDQDKESLVLVSSADRTVVANIGPATDLRGIEELVAGGATIETLLAAYDPGKTDEQKRVRRLLMDAAVAYAKKHSKTLMACDTEHLQFLERYAELTARKLEINISMQPLNACFAYYMIETRSCR